MVKQSERRQATRTAIIGAAKALFGEQGFSATTMDGIAAASGVAKGAVYHHFPNKEAVFEAVLDLVSAELAEEAKATSRRRKDPLQSMVAGIRFYFRTCSSGPRAQIVLRDGPAVLGWETWREIDHKHFGGMILKSLQHAMDDGVIAPQPLEPISRIILGAITEATIAIAARNNPPGAGDAYAAALASLIESLRVE
jgi:AcrR family transcriptional regulator